MCRELGEAEMLAVESLSVKIMQRADGKWLEKCLLEPLSFSLPKGAKLAIIGPNGAGKSTLMRALLGLIPAEYRAFSLAGRAFAEYRLSERAKVMSYVAQQPHFFSETTVFEWCELSRFPYGRGLSAGFRLEPEDLTAIESALATTEMLSFKNRSLSTLSGGEQQRAMLAGALAQETPVILLDEPNASLDPNTRQKQLQLLNRLEDKTILMITHDLNHLASVFTHVLGLSAGKLQFFGEIEQVLTAERLSDLFQYSFRVAWGEEGQRFYY